MGLNTATHAATADALGLRLQPLLSSNRTMQVVEQLTSLILNGKWKATQALPPERDLAAQLNVSRNVVREATKILQSRGLLSVKQGVGTIVNATNSEPVHHAFRYALHGQKNALLQLTEVRLLIEVEMASLAAQRATEENLQKIRSVLEEMERSLDDLARWVELDMAFHNALAEATQNSVFALVLEASATLTQQARVYALGAGTTTTLSLEMHRRIYEAVKDGDAVLAATRMRDHLKMIEDDIGQQAKRQRERKFIAFD